MVHGVKVWRGQYHQNWKVGGHGDGGEDAVIPNGTSERDWLVITVPAIEHGLYVIREALAIVKHYAELVRICHGPRICYEIKSVLKFRNTIIPRDYQDAGKELANLGKQHGSTLIRSINLHYHGREHLVRSPVPANVSSSLGRTIPLLRCLIGLAWVESLD